MNIQALVKTVARLGMLTAAVLAMAAVAPGAVFARPAPAPLSAADQALTQKAVSYLDGLRSAKGRFRQIDARGQTTTGALYLQRPGKARFQYDPPTGLLVVSDGINVSVYDQRLKSFDQYPLDQTPLSLLLSDKVRLGRGVAVSGVVRSPEGFSIGLRDAGRAAEGKLTLSFAENPVRLKGWVVEDPQWHTTTVRLLSLAPAAGLDPALFVLKDPRARAFP